MKAPLLFKCVCMSVIHRNTLKASDGVMSRRGKGRERAGKRSKGHCWSSFLAPDREREKRPLQSIALAFGRLHLLHCHVIKGAAWEGKKGLRTRKREVEERQAKQVRERVCKRVCACVCMCV